MSAKTKAVDALKLGGAYIAFCIGSGYATGQEIMQFFTSFGWQSFLACGVSLVLFVWLGMSLMAEGRSLQSDDGGKIFSYYCGRGLGTALDWFSVVFSFGVFTIMLAGAGATFNEYWGVPSLAGSALMGVLALVTVFMGLDKLVNVIGVIGPVIIVFSIAIGGISAAANLGNLANVNSVMQTVSIERPAANWAFSGALYTGYNAIILLPFLAQLSKTAKTRKTGVAGGFIGGLLLVLAIIVMNLGLLANLGIVHDKSIPVLTLASNIHPALAAVFVLILMGGIYSTAIPLMWIVCRRLAPEKTRKYKLVCVACVVAAVILSHMPFTDLVSIIYPYTGYMGVLVMACMLGKQVIARIKAAAARKGQSAVSPQSAR